MSDRRAATPSSVVRAQNKRSIVGAAAACMALGCQCASPMSTLPGIGDRQQSLRGEFVVDERIIENVSRSALRKPQMNAMVDAEIRAMVEYVGRHGRGELSPARIQEVQRGTGDHDWGPESFRMAPLLRLDNAAMNLLPFLDLDSGPRELVRVAMASLCEQLGDDAVYRALPEDGSTSATDLVFEDRDGVAFVALRALDDHSGDRFMSILNGWRRQSPPPRAVILDFARCEFGEPAAGSVIVNAFAPGREAFELTYFDPVSGSLETRAWHGDASVGASLDLATPVFVVTSSRTGGVAEAVAHALREYRTARILGGPTPGSGRVMAWYRLPWRAWFGFTVADIDGVDGKSLGGRPVIPDACLGDAGIRPLSERTLGAYHAACPGAAREVPSALAIDYVRALLSSEPRPGNAPSPKTPSE